MLRKQQWTAEKKTPTLTEHTLQWWIFSSLMCTTKFPKTVASSLSLFLHPLIISQVIATKSLSQLLRWKCSKKYQPLCIHNIQWTLETSVFILLECYVECATIICFPLLVIVFHSTDFFWEWLFLLLNIRTAHPHYLQILYLWILLL